MRVLLCGGGTAGHVMPAIAIGEIIEKSFPGATVAYAGRIDGKENSAYVKTGKKLYTVDISGFNRSLSINNIKSIFKALKSGRKAKEILRDFKPDLIIGTGGYVCYPFIRQGQLLGIKTVMHESNVIPGLVTRLLGKKCNKLLLNLEGTKKHFKSTANTLVVGNPIRHAFDGMTKKEAKRLLCIPNDHKLIVSFGGSLGSEILNETVAEFMEKYIAENKSIHHIHATGRTKYEQIKASHSQLFTDQVNIKILPYIDNMPVLLKAADVAVTRSGAMTVSELCKCGTPSVLIPSPNVSANHQLLNARYMEEEGASVVIEEKDLCPEKLDNEIGKILRDPKKANIMAYNAGRIYPKNTEVLIVEALRELIPFK